MDQNGLVWKKWIKMDKNRETESQRERKREKGKEQTDG